jgi:hypothetical protein
MQRGSLVCQHRKQGPDVWQFRWSEYDPNGRRIYRKRVIGTVEQYSDSSAARGAVSGLLLRATPSVPGLAFNPLPSLSSVHTSSNMSWREKIRGVRSQPRKSTRLISAVG